MPTINKRFTAWSYSRYKEWRECPLRAYLKHIAKLDEVERSPAMVRGETIHKQAESYVRGDLRRLPKELRSFTQEFAALRKVKAIPEGEWAFDVQWNPVPWKDWNRAWCRMKLDAHHLATPTRARVIDYKTGKIYGDNEEQVELYVVGGFATYPQAKEVEVQLWYTDQGLLLPKQESDRVYTAKEGEKLKRAWRVKVTPMLSEKTFPPRPGPYCGRCSFSKANGGPCKF